MITYTLVETMIEHEDLLVNKIKKAMIFLYHVTLMERRLVICLQQLMK